MDDLNTSAQQVAQLREENERLRASLEQSNIPLREEVAQLRASVQQSSLQVAMLQALRDELRRLGEERARLAREVDYWQG